jgi:hypothetical protein
MFAFETQKKTFCKKMRIQYNNVFKKINVFS